MVPWGVWDEGSLPSSVPGLQLTVVLVQGDLGVGAVPRERLHHLGEGQHVGVVADVADGIGEETQCWLQQVVKALCRILGSSRKSWEDFGEPWLYNNNSRDTGIYTHTYPYTYVHTYLWRKRKAGVGDIVRSG